MGEKRDLVFERNTGLVFSVIHKNFSNYKNREDLIQTGYVGLLKAIDSFNPIKGVKFSTYATRCILNEIYNYVLKDSTVKIPNRYNHKDVIVSTVSLDMKIPGDDESKTITLQETIEGSNNIEDYIEKESVMMNINGFIDKEIKNSLHKKIMKDYIDQLLITGRKNIALLANVYGMNSSTMNNLVNDYLLKLKTYLISIK